MMCNGHTQQQGSMLIEGMVAILIFSVGILALMGLQAASIANSVESKYRADASYLANQLVAQMRVSTGFEEFRSGGAKFQAWETEVAKVLPGAEGDCAPTINIDSDDVVELVIRWNSPQQDKENYGGEACRQFEVKTQVRGN